MTEEIKKYEYLKFNKSLNEEYLLLQEKYEKIYNKDFTVVLMQVGSFHEIYATDSRGYNLHKLSNLLNIIVFSLKYVDSACEYFSKYSLHNFIFLPFILE